MEASIESLLLGLVLADDDQAILRAVAEAIGGTIAK